MPGAVITIDQVRPGPTISPGTPGVARNDGWVGRQVQLHDGAGGNSTWDWFLLGAPPGSAATLASSTTANPTFTPDLPGTYRVQLVTNGGGPGNVQIRLIRVRYDTNGVLLNRGWCLPAWDERGGEANYPGNDVDWAECFYFMFADIEQTIDKIITPTIVEIPLSAGRQQTASTTPDEIGAAAFNPAVHAPGNAHLTRVIQFVVVIEAGVGGQTCSIELYNLTDGVTVCTLTTTNTFATIGRSATLAVPADLPNSEKLYVARLKRIGGGVNDLVSCKSARIEVLYS
jgi:hypothetical protein